MPDDERTAPAADQQAPETAAADVPSQTAVAAPVADDVEPHPASAAPEQAAIEPKPLAAPPATIAGAPASAAQLAYEAYGDARAWKTANGGDMPRWHDQRPELCDAWGAAAAAVAAVCTPPTSEPRMPTLVEQAACLAQAIDSARADGQERGDHLAVSRDLVGRALEILRHHEALPPSAG